MRGVLVQSAQTQELPPLRLPLLRRHKGDGLLVSPSVRLFVRSITNSEGLASFCAGVLGHV